MKMDAIRSSETLAHTRSTRRHIPEDAILHSHRRENLKSYIVCVVPKSLRGPPTTHARPVACPPRVGP
jgi:hypothetical protein